MNKQDLANKVHDMLGGTKTQAEDVVNSMFDTIRDAMARGEEVSIAGFGIFSAKKRAARTARNPKTGEPVHVPETMVPKFRASKALKDAVK